MRKSKIRPKLKKPYWAAGDDLPSWDFCREIVKPGENKIFPEGALGLRVDDDFFAVAVLPMKYADWKLKDIVEDLWPYAWQATFHPDSGTMEQKIEWLERNAYFDRIEIKGLYSKIRRLERDLRHYTWPAKMRKRELGDEK